VTEWVDRQLDVKSPTVPNAGLRIGSGQNGGMRYAAK
jgi:hypothetical protein